MLAACGKWLTVSAHTSGKTTAVGTFTQNRANTPPSGWLSRPKIKFWRYNHPLGGVKGAFSWGVQLLGRSTPEMASKTAGSSMVEGTGASTPSAI